MIQEDKQLLLKDLCARFPYGVMCQTDGHGKIHKLKGINKHKGLWWYEFDGFRIIKLPKPYLRPLSSMKDGEKKEQNNIALFHSGNIASIPTYIDFLNRHHFDYRGLIEKGLALEAPKGMYE